MSYDHQKDNPLSPWLPANNSMKNKTGKWAIYSFYINQEICTHCLKCWISCPDSAISIQEGKLSINGFYCKGCGICETECPVKAIVKVS